VGSLFRTATGQLRIVSVLEAVSYLVLLFVAMPLKYLADAPAMVQLFGRAHGAFFILYVVCVVRCAIVGRWPAKRTGWALFASLLPFAPFWVERRLAQDERAPA
jgi:integral membrane protein